MERTYKDLGNMLYGKIVCGISNKKVYDARTLDMKTMIDGFVTDIEDLEQKIIDNFDIEGSLLQGFRDIRRKLSNQENAVALEVKTSTEGIIQWTTRGQLSLDTSKTGTPITAATGYQKSKNHEENISIVQQALVNGNRVLFLQKSLTGALDCYKTNTNVSMKSQQRIFRTIFDCKRLVITSESSMLYTQAFNDVTEALLHRKLMMQLKQSVYSDEFTVFTVKPSQNSLDETVKLFIRMISNLFDNSTTVQMKYNMIQIIQGIKPQYTDKYILDLFSYYELDKAEEQEIKDKFKMKNEFSE
ncbi:hypothetical protein HOY80DRAFT_1026807 [Tuber brumale]|nr:hypothetical protein HOY80DRAFT_1026807 [Tuber brumale]